MVLALMNYKSIITSHHTINWEKNGTYHAKCLQQNKLLNYLSTIIMSEEFEHCFSKCLGQSFYQNEIHVPVVKFIDNFELHLLIHH